MSRPILFWLLAAAVSTSALGADTKSLPSDPSHEVTTQEMQYLVGLCEGCHGRGGDSKREDLSLIHI